MSNPFDDWFDEERSSVDYEEENDAYDCLEDMDFDDKDLY